MSHIKESILQLRATMSPNSLPTPTRKINNQPPEEIVKRKPNKTKDDTTFYKVPPHKTANNEDNIYTSRGKYYTNAQYGISSRWLLIPEYEKLLNQTKKETKVDMCQKKLDQLNEVIDTVVFKKYPPCARQHTEKCQSFQKEIRAIKVERRSEKIEVEDEKEAEAILINRNAEKALLDQEPEMKDFYSVVANAQVLAMQNMQKADNEVLKKMGVRSLECYNIPKEEEVVNEYEQLKADREKKQETNASHLGVLGKQAEEKRKLKDLERLEIMKQKQLDEVINEQAMYRMLEDKRLEEEKKREQQRELNEIKKYRDQVKDLRKREDDLLYQREKDWLENKAAFNLEVELKKQEIKDKQEAKVKEAQSNLLQEFAAQEEAMKYYYVSLYKAGKAIEQRELEEKLQKEEGMREFLREADKIIERNKKLKEEEQRVAQEDYEKRMKVQEMEIEQEKAKEKKKKIDQDICRMEMLAQIQENESKRVREREDKAYENELLKSTEFIRMDKVKNRMMDVIEEMGPKIPERARHLLISKYELFCE